MKLKYLFFCLLANLMHGQQNNTEPGNKYFDPQIKSPGVSDFVKYGNISSTSYTGELKLDIPIINVAIPYQNDFSISLSHVASGFRPSKRSGLVGQNWFLNLGGAITREVFGVPDEQKGQPNNNGTPNYHTNGFLVGVKTRAYNSNSVYGGVAGTSYTSTNFERYMYANASSNGLDPNNYECDPDMFSFNFNGISGSFFIGNDGQVRVTTSSPERLTVDLSELALQEVINNNGGRPKVPSRIVIIDSKGNKYHFGGETKNLEYSMGMPALGNAKPVISAWYLAKVEYYTGYVINFNYRDDSILLYGFADESITQHGGYYADPVGGAADRKDFLMLSEFYSDERSLLEFNGSFSGNGSVGGYGGGTLSLSLQKIAILENIVGDDFRINFNYSKQAHKFNTRDNPNTPAANNSLFNNFKDIKLDYITLLSKQNTPIKTFGFSYQYLGGSHSRMYLNSFGELGKPPHEFEYYDTGNLPQPITFGIDHWGFWNGKNATTNQLIPKINLSSNGDFTYGTDAASTSRNPAFAFALKGQLLKVKYPTGGHTTFEYDEHRYSQRLEIRSSQGFVPQLYASSDIAGGVRIKKITDFDGISSQNVHQKNYSYSTGDEIVFTSHGILFKWPRYASFWTSGLYKFGYLRSSTIGRNMMDTPHIAYSEVVEATSGNGSMRTKFTDFISNPDLNNSYFISANNFSNGATPAGLAKNYIGYFLNDTSIERGKPQWIKKYDNTGSLKEETSFEYNKSPTKYDNFTTRIHTTGPFIQFNKIYSYQDYLTKKTTKSYLPSSFISMTVTDQLTYDPINNQVTSEKTTGPANDFSEMQYVYTEVPSLNLILLDRKKSFRNTQKLLEEQFIYGNTTTASTAFRYLPIKILSSKFPNDNPQQNGETSLDVRFNFHKYDNKGNPLEVSAENGTHTVYLWNASKTRPFAIIENATYSEVASSLGLTGEAVGNLSESNIATINNLRNNPQFQKAMITVYHFSDTTGQLLRVTDSKGFTHKYFYDQLERLQFVTDMDGYDPNGVENGNLIMQYNYNYKH